MKKGSVFTEESRILARLLAAVKANPRDCQASFRLRDYFLTRDANGNTHLINAVLSPDGLKFARKLLRAGAAAYGTNALGETPLFIASRAGYESAVQLLLQYKAYPNFATRSGQTALMAATDRENTGVVRLLLLHRADPAARNCDGATALMMASKQGNPEVVQALVEAGSDVDAHDRKGQTPLMIACVEGHKDVVAVLLDAGAETSVTSPSGWTALMFAEAGNYTDIANMLKVDSSVDEEADAAMVATAFDEEAIQV